MKLLINARELDLSYCSNIHQASRLKDLVFTLDNVLPFLKNQLNSKSMGIGMYLSNSMLKESVFSNEELIKWLDGNNYHLYTLNGFPYCNFHQSLVKDLVYLPNWSEEERLSYTKKLIYFLSNVIEGNFGSISTVPIGYKKHKIDYSKVLENIKNLVIFLEEIENATGKLISVAFEHEPGCFLETTDDVISFFNELTLFFRNDNYKRYLGICYDICHMAVMFQDPIDSVDKLIKNDIKILKTQISSAIRVFDIKKNLNDLIKLNESKYLHQVTGLRNDNKLIYFDDLNDFFEMDLSLFQEARIHYHVPLHYKNFGSLMTTNRFTSICLQEILKKSDCTHFEIETYTFNEFNPKFLNNDILNQNILKEMQWCIGEFSKHI